MGRDILVMFLMIYIGSGNVSTAPQKVNSLNNVVVEVGQSSPATENTGESAK